MGAVSVRSKIRRVGGVLRKFSPTDRFLMSSRLWVAVSVFLVAIEVWLSVRFWDWLTTGGESPSTTIRNIGLVMAGTVAFPLAIWRGLVADRQASAAQLQTKEAQRQAETAQRVLLNERYQTGAEMLGSSSMTVRLGGIYALERLASEHPEDYHVQVVKLFCAFARNPTENNEAEFYREGSVLRADVQDVMQAIASRSAEGVAIELTEDFKLYLRGANISSLQVQYANLSRAWLTNAKLSGAVLPYANLSGARLRRADLSGAKLWGANLTGTMLRDADLTGADLYGADAQSSTYNVPVRGLTQAQLDEASAEPGIPPKLDGVLDSESNKQLVWRGESRR